MDAQQIQYKQQMSNGPVVNPSPPTNFSRGPTNPNMPMMLPQQANPAQYYQMQQQNFARNINPAMATTTPPSAFSKPALQQQPSQPQMQLPAMAQQIRPNSQYPPQQYQMYNGFPPQQMVQQPAMMLKQTVKTPPLVSAQMGMAPLFPQSVPVALSVGSTTGGNSPVSTQSAPVRDEKSAKRPAGSPASRSPADSFLEIENKKVKTFEDEADLDEDDQDEEGSEMMKDEEE